MLYSTKPSSALTMPNKKAIHRFIYLATLIIISGCASKPSYEIQQPDWEISGKLAVREPQRSTTLLFNWQQKNDHYLIHLMNPLGQIQLTLVGNKHYANAVDSDGNIHQANNAEQLLLNLTGWQFPIQSAQLWLQGKADKSADKLQYSEQRLSDLQSRQWQVALSHYRPIDGQQLPHRLRIVKEDGLLTLILIIKQHAHFLP